jgi:hypothetical protein
MATYTLNPSIPALVTPTNPVAQILSAAGAQVMWQDLSGVKHIFACYGGVFYPWSGMYVNTSTGFSTSFSNTSYHGSAGGGDFTCYHPTANKLYITGAYHAYMTELDPVTGTIKLIYNAPIDTIGYRSTAHYNTLIGDDSRVYWGSGDYYLFSYDPLDGDGVLEEYGPVTLDIGTSRGYFPVGVSATHIYAGTTSGDSEGPWHLWISPIGNPATWTPWEFDEDDDVALSITKVNGYTPGYWYVMRGVGWKGLSVTVAIDGSNATFTQSTIDWTDKFTVGDHIQFTHFANSENNNVAFIITNITSTVITALKGTAIAEGPSAVKVFTPRYYHLTGDTYEVIAAPPANGPGFPENPPLGPVYCSGYSSNWSTNYGYTINTDHLYPIKDVNEAMTLGYKATADEDYTWVSVPFEEDHWEEAWANVVVQLDGQSVFVLPGGGNSVCLIYDYRNEIHTYLGKGRGSPYYGVKLPGNKLIFSGYTSFAALWDQSLPWNDIGSNYNVPCLPGDADTNPYNIIVNGPNIHYRDIMVYDYNGLVWIGGETVGALESAIQGVIRYYNPVDGAGDDIFYSVEQIGIKGNDLCHAMNRTKIVACSKNSTTAECLLHVIDVDTKEVEGTYDLNKRRAWIIEVDYDQVLGITPGTDYSDTDTSSTAWQIFLFKPSTRTMIIPPQSIGVTGRCFGVFVNHISRLTKGPDGYVWLWIGADTLYRINPKTLSASLVTTIGGAVYGQPCFANNGRDLIFHNAGQFDYIPDIFFRVAYKGINGSETGKLNGAYCGKVNGVAQ